MEPHELDVVSLIAGLLFVAIGIGHLAGVHITGLAFSGLLPLLLIVAGAILLVRATRSRTHDT